MKLRLRLSLLAALGLGVATAGCQEQLTAPGSCPANCPGGTPVLRDTVLDAIVGQDSIHSDFFRPGGSTAGLRVANGFLGATNYGVIRFLARESTIPVRDTALDSLIERTYTIDSTAIEVTLLARDTSASGIRLALHRIGLTTDSTATFGGVDAQVVSGTLIDSVTIADSVLADSVATGFKYRFVFLGDTTPNMQIAPGDSGKLEMAVAISGPSATGVRVGGTASGDAVPKFYSYVTLNVTDTATAVKHQFILRRPAFTTFVSNSSLPAPDSTILAIGTPSIARAYIRFDWPPYLKDSALLARATLEMVPAQAIDGLPGDSAFVTVYGVVADFGAKSPLSAVSGGSRALLFGSVDTVRVDVISEIVRWQGTRLPHPPLLVVKVQPEGTSFTEPRFFSTRETIAARRPRLRITYQAPFDFERP